MCGSCDWAKADMPEASWVHGPLQLPPSLIAWSLRLLVFKLWQKQRKESHTTQSKSQRKEKKDTESSLGLVKNRQTPKTFK